jgi:DNA polymerase-3 subunit gamma/tau
VAYVVLARKWRPKRFEDVVGQEHITTALVNSIRSDRTAHAYLFVGPRGIGKTSTARIFATALNCGQASEGEPCGECDVCREIAVGRSIDVMEIDGASNNGVEDIRTLRENVRIAPASLRFKVYIIDEVHMLSTGAFNAFLKTLEEPPEHVKFIMATTEAHKIPATVLSRCQRFDFRRLTSRQIHGKLKAIVDAEGIKVGDGALFAIARAADGSMRDAQSILDQLVSFSDSEITLDDVHAMLGAVGHDVHHKLAVAISEADSFAILKTIDDIVERGKDLAQFLKEFPLYVRNLLVASYGGGEDLIDMSDEDLTSLKEVSDRFERADLVRMAEDLSDFTGRFRQFSSTRVATEMLLMKMAHVGADVSIEGLISKLTAMEKRLKGGGNPSAPAGGNAHGASYVKEPRAPRPPRESGAPQPVEPPDEEEEQPEPPEPRTEEDKGEPQLGLWRQFLDEVRAQRMSTYSFLSAGRFCGIEKGEAIICFDPENGYNKRHLEEKNVKKLLEETLKAVAGEPVKIKLIIESAKPEAPPASIPEPAKPKGLAESENAEKKRYEEVMNDPIVRKTIELFKGKIVHVTG